MEENLDNKIEELQKQLKVLELQKQIQKTQEELSISSNQLQIPIVENVYQLQEQFVEQTNYSQPISNGNDYNGMEEYFVELFSNYHSINMAKNTIKLKSKSGVTLGEYHIDKQLFLISYENVNKKFYDNFKHKFDWKVLQPFLYDMFLKYLNLSNVLITTKALYDNPLLGKEINLKEENRRCEFGNFDKLQDMSSKGIL